MADALPKTTDVEAALSSISFGSNLGAGDLFPDNFDYQSELASAITSWDALTVYSPFFQTVGTPVALALDPPGPNDRFYVRGGTGRLLLPNGLISLTSLYTDVNAATNQVGQQLTQGQDFWLYPSDAQMRGIPFTRVDFAYPVRGLPQSIVITGVWGYCQTTLPDDAWSAIRDLAMARCLETLLEGLKTGLIETRDIQQSQKFDPGLIATLGEGIRKRAEAVVPRYRLLSA